MKSNRFLLVLFAVLSFVVAGCSMVNMRSQFQEELQIRTESGPIYHHFPGLPETKRVEWCSTTSDGIGPSTVNLYLFAFLSDAASMENVINQGSLTDAGVTIDSIFLPEDLRDDETWSQLLNVPFCFQEELPIARRMNTEVYINGSRDVIYVHAIG